MSEENVELVRGIFGACENLDLAAIMRDADPGDLRALYESVYDRDIEVTWVDTNPNPGPFRGIDAAMRAFEEWFESFDEFFMRTTEYLDAGGQGGRHRCHARARQGQRSNGRDDGLLRDCGQGRQDRE